MPVDAIAGYFYVQDSVTLAPLDLVVFQRNGTETLYALPFSGMADRGQGWYYVTNPYSDSVDPLGVVIISALDPDQGQHYPLVFDTNADWNIAAPWDGGPGWAVTLEPVAPPPPPPPPSNGGWT
jgi:hypothetical protein